jgi:hypothetical protein
MFGRIGDENDAPAVATIAAIRAAPGHKFFTAEGDRPRAAPAAFNLEPDLIDKNFPLTPGASADPAGSDPVLKKTRGTPRALADRFTFQRQNTDLFLGPVIVLVDHPAVCGGKKGVIPALADIGSGVNTAAPLTDKDTACFDHLAAVTLDAQPFGLAVTTVS